MNQEGIRKIGLSFYLKLMLTDISFFLEYSTTLIIESFKDHPIGAQNGKEGRQSDWAVF